MEKIKPDILVLFSGGLDSTGVLYKLIHSKENLLVHHLHLYPRRQKTQYPLGAGMNGGKITHTHTLYMMSHLGRKIS